MRYQERLYITNTNSAVRNKDILNVSTSSDMCIFSRPTYIMSGTTKIPTSGETIDSGSTGVYLFSANTGNIDISFDFTGNTSSFIDNDTMFKYEIYKYDNNLGIFDTTLYQSGDIEWSSFSATSAFTDSIDVSSLNIDGDYLVKGYFNHNFCTEFYNYLDRRIDTLDNKSGDKFGLYEPSYDYFFVAIREAEEPTLGSAEPATSLGNLVINSIIATGDETTYIIPTSNQNSFILALNGSVLAPEYDYYFSANTGGGVTIDLAEPTITGDVLTYATIGTGIDDTVKYDIIDIQESIISGVTDGEGSEDVYYNTDTGKYELFTTLTPTDATNVGITLNGATLANNIDYYQSVSNPKRIILEGDLAVDDIIIVFYAANPQISGEIFDANATIGWSIPTAPTLLNGFFTVEVSTNDIMGNIVHTASTPYVVDVTTYSTDVFFSGGVGTTLYYRVKNEKQYESIKGDLIISDAYSEIVPITIQTNSFNSY